MEHSKTPWRIGMRYNSIVSDDSFGPMISVAEAVEHYGGYMVAESVAEANARRIVACVNACAGLDTALLENITMLGDTLKDRIDVLRNEANQRDELLTSLGAASNYIDHLGGLSNGYRAVIQKVRGGE